MISTMMVRKMRLRVSGVAAGWFHVGEADPAVRELPLSDLFTRVVAQ